MKFESPDNMMIVYGNWYHHSQLEDDLRASMAFDRSSAKAKTTHIGTRTLTIAAHALPRPPDMVDRSML